MTPEHTLVSPTAVPNSTVVRMVNLVPEHTMVPLPPAQTAPNSTAGIRQYMEYITIPVPNLYQNITGEVSASDANLYTKSLHSPDQNSDPGNPNAEVTGSSQRI